MVKFSIEWLISIGILVSVLTFPIVSLRSIGAVIFGIHWLSFLFGRIVRQKHFRNESGTQFAAIASHIAASLLTLRLLGHTSVDVWNTDQISTCMMLLWVIYRASTTRPGRMFPYFRRGSPTPSRLLTWSGQALRTFIEGMPLWILLALKNTAKNTDVDTNNLPNTNGSNTTNNDLYRGVGFVLWCAGATIARSAHFSRPAGSSLSAVAAGQSVDARPEQLLSTMRAGIWKYSRHPDFFAEFIVWCGITFMFWPALHHTTVTNDNNAAAAENSVHVTWLQCLVWISPLFSIVSHCAFTIRSIEKDEMLRFGHLPSYRSYISSTWPFVPLPLLSNSETLLALNIDADAQEFIQPTNRGAYKSSRADTITEALQASKAAKIIEKQARTLARQKQMAKQKKKTKKREKTPKHRVQIK